MLIVDSKRQISSTSTVYHPIPPDSSNPLKLRDGSTLCLKLSSNSFSFEITDKFGITQNTQNIVFTTVPEELIEELDNAGIEQRDRVMVNHLQSFFEHYSHRSMVSEIQIIYQDRQPIIVVAPYGLQGGLNKSSAILGGGALGACGVTLIVFSGGTLLPIVGAAALGAGVNGTLYSIKTPEEKINFSDFATEAAVGAVSGAISGGVGAVTRQVVQSAAIEGTKKIACVALGSAISGACSVSASKVTKNLLTKQPLATNITVTDVLVGAASGACSSLAAAGATSLVQGLVPIPLLNPDENFHEHLSKGTKVVIGALSGSVGGAIGGATAVLVDEGCKKVVETTKRKLESSGLWTESTEKPQQSNQSSPSLKERVIESMITGAVIGGVIGACQAAKNHDDYEKMKAELEEERKKGQALIEEEMKKNEELLAELKAETLKGLAELDAQRIELEKQSILDGPEGHLLEQLKLNLERGITARNSDFERELYEAVKQKWRYADGQFAGKRVDDDNRKVALELLKSGQTILFKVDNSRRNGQMAMCPNGVFRFATRERQNDSYFKKHPISNLQGLVAEQQAKVDQLLAAASQPADLAALIDDPNTVNQLRDALQKTSHSSQEPVVGHPYRLRSSERGVEVRFIKETPLNPHPPVEINPKNVLWNDASRCLSCSEQSYVHLGGSVEGMIVVGHIKQSYYGLDLYAYLNPHTNDLILSFKGSAQLKQWIHDNSHLITNGVPKSVNSSLVDGVRKILEAYPEARPTFTGHSLGAALASIFSHVFNIEAICFDNPGVSGEFNTQKVTSFQAISNPINGSCGRVGNIVQMSTETSSALVARECSGALNPILGGGTYLWTGLAAHSIDSIKCAFDRTYRLLTGGSSNGRLEQYIYDGSNIKYQNRYSAELSAEIGTLSHEPQRLSVKNFHHHSRII